MAFIPLIGMPGPTEIIIILAIVLLLFGGRKIPELMRGLGKGMKEFKNAQKNTNDTTENDEKKEDDIEHKEE